MFSILKWRGGGDIEKIRNRCACKRKQSIIISDDFVKDWNNHRNALPEKKRKCDET